MANQSTLRRIGIPLALISYLSISTSAPAGPASAEPPTYKATFITPGLSAISAAAMNQAGDVVGTTATPRAWISLAGAPAIELPLAPGLPYSFAYDIADTGVIVGSVNFGQFSWMGFAAAWVPNAVGGYDIVQYGTLPGDVGSVATAVNNVGDVIGHSYDGMFRTAVLFTAPGGIQDLSPTGIFDPVDINDERVLIDHSFTCKRLDLDTMLVQDLGTADDPPGGSTGYASSRGEAINESGQVAGSVRLATSTNCDHQAARFTEGIGWEVLSVCGQNNSAWDINDQGDIIMRLNVAPYVRFEGIGSFLIEDLIVADAGHWFVINGFGLAINNSRQLAVPASNDETNQGGIILLTPISVEGDVTADGVVDEQDRIALCSAMGSSLGEAGYLPSADLNQDGVIDHLDLAAFSTMLPPCIGDVVTSATFQPPADGFVDGADLAYLLGEWGPHASCADFVSSATFQPPPDGLIDGADLAALLGGWGPCE